MPFTCDKQSPVRTLILIIKSRKTSYRSQINNTVIVLSNLSLLFNNLRVYNVPGNLINNEIQLQNIQAV